MMFAVFTWGYDPRSGEPYLDNYLLVPPYTVDLYEVLPEGHPKKKEIESTCEALFMIKVRQRVQNTRMIVLRGKYTREECEVLVKSLPKEKLIELSRD